MMVIRRRALLAAVSMVTVSLYSGTRTAAQVAGLSKSSLPIIFGGLQVAFAAISLLAEWLVGDSPEAHAALCKLSADPINDLRFRCFSVALALDSTGDGPVIPPEKGTIGIIPALADFSLKQNPATISAIRDASARILDASQNLFRELAMDIWLPSLVPAGMKPEDVETLSENLKYISPRLAEFMSLYDDKLPTTPYDIETANKLSKQLSEMPTAAKKAIVAIRRIQEKRYKTSCRI